MKREWKLSFQKCMGMRKEVLVSEVSSFNHLPFALSRIHYFINYSWIVCRDEETNPLSWGTWLAMRKIPLELMEESKPVSSSVKFGSSKTELNVGLCQERVIPSSPGDWAESTGNLIPWKYDKTWIILNCRNILNISHERADSIKTILPFLTLKKK